VFAKSNGAETAVAVLGRHEHYENITLLITIPCRLINILPDDMYKGMA
jgi:hypothetical protein